MELFMMETSLQNIVIVTISWLTIDTIHIGILFMMESSLQNIVTISRLCTAFN